MVTHLISDVTASVDVSVIVSESIGATCAGRGALSFANELLCISMPSTLNPQPAHLQPIDERVIVVGVGGLHRHAHDGLRLEGEEVERAADGA